LLTFDFDPQQLNGKVTIAIYNCAPFPVICPQITFSNLVTTNVNTNQTLHT